MMDAQLLEFTLARVNYKDWKFITGDMGEGFFIQSSFVDKDHDTGKPSEIKGRKWYISKHAIVDEVIKTAWLAVEIAQRHEAMESFLVDGKAPFHPHNEFSGMLDLPKCHRQEIAPKPIDGAIDPAEEEMLTADEAAKAIKCSPQTIYRLIKYGDLECVYIGRSIKISRAQIRRFILKKGTPK